MALFREFGACAPNRVRAGAVLNLEKKASLGSGMPALRALNKLELVFSSVQDRPAFLTSWRVAKEPADLLTYRC